MICPVLPQAPKSRQCRELLVKLSLSPVQTPSSPWHKKVTPHPRNLSQLFILVTTSVLVMAAVPTTCQAEKNVLLIIVDDLGLGDLSCQEMAEDVQTPHIDELIRDSLRFDRFYANCPVCSPTRASVITGCYPDRVGVPGVIRTHDRNSWGYYSPYTQTLPEQLQEQGYYTKAIGKWHLGLREENHPQQRGFHHFHGFLGDMMDDYYHHRRHNVNYMREGLDMIVPEGHATDLFSDWAASFVRSRKPTSQPWFLYLAYNAPHTPIQPPKDWFDKVKQREGDITDQRAKLVALIEHMDAGIGQVLSALKESGQYNNTVIAFTSDNGGQTNVGANNGPTRDGKQSMYEGGLRIPGSLRIPGITSAGSRTDQVCATMDLYPTIIDAVGGKVPDDIDGLSLMPIIRDRTKSLPERDLYFVRREGGPRYAGLSIEAVLHGDYKLVHNLPTSSLELFHLGNDPLETNDLSQSHPKIFRQMTEKLQRHVQRGGRIPWQKTPRDDSP